MVGIDCREVAYHSKVVTDVNLPHNLFMFDALQASRVGREDVKRQFRLQLGDGKSIYM